MLLDLNDEGVKFRGAYFILLLPVRFFMDLKIFLSVILEGSFCYRYLHPLDDNIPHIEHDFLPLGSTQETVSIDVFFKKNCSKAS